MTALQQMPHVTCPLCHTSDDMLTVDAMVGDRSWQCPTCGHGWTAARLATAAAYTAWAVAWDRPVTQA
jgi:transposase-like protein